MTEHEMIALLEGSWWNGSNDAMRRKLVHAMHTTDWNGYYAFRKRLADYLMEAWRKPKPKMN